MHSCYNTGGVANISIVISLHAFKCVRLCGFSLAVSGGHGGRWDFVKHFVACRAASGILCLYCTLLVILIIVCFDIGHGLRLVCVHVAATHAILYR